MPQWIPHPRADLERARALAGTLDAPFAAAQALVNRGFGEADLARRFLDPTLEDLHDPFLLQDIDRAVVRIERAIESGERILVHGDYDVDGITSTFLLGTVLARLGARVAHRIPHRTRDGYGLSVVTVEEAARRDYRLVITVDCGVTAFDAVRRARELGVDVVITDHHEPPPVLPDAEAIVNPHRVDCPYPFKALAGVGVTFKLVEALLARRGMRERAGEFLDVVAIGTIADVVPLVGENRILARAGLQRMNPPERLGLKALAEVSGLEGRVITSGQVAFVLAPRRNAAGRMGNAEQGLRLLLARDTGEARACAESLEEENERRRAADEAVLEDALRAVESTLEWPDCSSIVLWSDRWHPGVIGIVAARLVERFHRPALLVSVASGGGTCRGSGRSLPGLELHRLLGRCDDLLETYGGHALAAGFTVRPDRLPELRARFEALVRERRAPESCVGRLTVDGDLALGDCHLDLVGWLDRLSPHGLQNPEPVFSARGVAIESMAAVADGRHLRLRVRDASGAAEAIGFGFGEHAERLRGARACDVAFVPVRNEWMGEVRVQLRLKDVRPL
jgi:single-stranded-DNA-specific exonuclease